MGDLDNSHFHQNSVAEIEQKFSSHISLNSETVAQKFETTHESQSSYMEERKSLLNPKIPEDMPSLSVIREEISETKLPDSVIWCQGTKLSTYLKVNFNGITVNPSRLFVQITAETLSVSYLDISYDDFDHEIYKYFEIPQIILFSDVIPTATKIKFSASGFEIR